MASAFSKTITLTKSETTVILSSILPSGMIISPLIHPIQSPKVAIYNRQDESTIHMWPDLWPGDFQAQKSMVMTPNVLPEANCHQTTQTQINSIFSYLIYRLQPSRCQLGSLWRGRFYVERSPCMSLVLLWLSHWSLAPVLPPGYCSPARCTVKVVYLSKCFDFITESGIQLIRQLIYRKLRHYIMTTSIRSQFSQFVQIQLCYYARIKLLIWILVVIYTTVS